MKKLKKEIIIRELGLHNWFLLWLEALVEFFSSQIQKKIYNLRLFTSVEIHAPRKSHWEWSWGIVT